MADSTCSVAGCDGDVVARGLCRGHYSRQYRGQPLGGPIVRHDSASARFWAKVDRRGAEECWPWLGAVQSSGYGNFAEVASRADKRHELAHRFAYRELVGPIPDDLTIDHLCRDRLCVNPGHMEVVPFATNLERRVIDRDDAGRFA